MPECRTNNVPGYTQGGASFSFRDLSQRCTHGGAGSSADNIVAHFAVNYPNEAEDLGIDLTEMYSAMLADAELNPPEWNTLGRQVNVYKSVNFLSIMIIPLTQTCRKYGYVPFAVLDPSSTGRQTREASRTLEVPSASCIRNEYVTDETCSTRSRTLPSLKLQNFLTKLRMQPNTTIGPWYANTFYAPSYTEDRDYSSGIVMCGILL